MPVEGEAGGFMIYIRNLDKQYLKQPSLRVKISKEQLGDLLLITKRPWHVDHNLHELSFSPEKGGVRLAGRFDQVQQSIELDYGETANFLAFVESELPKIYGWSARDEKVSSTSEVGSMYLV
jgi:hypothetical protein